MKNKLKKHIFKKSIMCFGVLTIVGTLVGCNMLTKTEDINIYYTSDLHSHYTNNLRKYISKIDRKNSLLVDAGDFIDIQTEDDSAWANGYKDIGVVEEIRGIVIEKFAKPSEGTPPIVKKMFEDKYDLAVVGNHEFYSSSKEFKELIDIFNSNGTPLLSANTYYDKKMIGGNENKRISEPYVIKKYNTEDGEIKVGIIGATTNTINEEESFEGKDLKAKDDVLLQSSPEYKDKFFMTDLVDETVNVAKELKEKENPDMILLIAHSGEKPKKPKHSGNRIQELAQKVPGVDMIIAGHTHVFIDKHEYDGPDGRKVVVSQPGNIQKV